MADLDNHLVSDLLTLCTAIASEAAELVTERRPSIAAVETTSLDTKSSATDIVTEVDRAAEALIVERILASRPDDSIIGEEGTGVVGASGVEWVIDPIDGTTSFVYGYPGFCISVAIRFNNETIVGVVADPVHDCVYAGARGQGATCNGAPISVTDASTLGAALVATGFSYDPARRRRQAEVLMGLLPEIRDIRRSGSAALDLCFVACGKVDAYYEVGLNLWDLAAGLLIAEEAGARSIAEFPEGHPPFTVAAAPGISEALFRSLDDHDARLHNR